MRDYQPGDPLRMIHWPTSARMGKLFVRTFDGAPAGDWWILLDLEESTLAGSGFNSTEEHAVILAALLADRLGGLRRGAARRDDDRRGIAEPGDADRDRGDGAASAAAARCRNALRRSAPRPSRRLANPQQTTGP